MFLADRDFTALNPSNKVNGRRETGSEAHKLNLARELFGRTQKELLVFRRVKYQQCLSLGLVQVIAPLRGNTI